MGDIDIRKVKLVIWDLDETLWNGTVSEEEVTVPKENIDLVRNLDTIGIVNSICSKNEFNVAHNKLVEIGLCDLFVFPSISWGPKGSRVRQIIENMNLRNENVLFIDDNVHNLEEVRYSCKNVMTAEPSIIPLLIQQLRNYDLTSSKSRLRSYRILEEKQTKRLEFSTNEDFLRDSMIGVNIFNDCLSEKDRIYELVNRTNQLNYTKIRLTLSEIEKLLLDPFYVCGYVKVDDKFGDYGLVGFYALNKQNNILEHFLFSCRTLGMGVEQYLYQVLGFPKITVIGDVITDLSPTNTVDWINETESKTACATRPERFSETLSIIAKGPCDLDQTMVYFDNSINVDTEFTYLSESNFASIESHNHTYGIIGALTFSNDLKMQLADRLPFIDKNTFDTKLFSRTYNVFIFSLLSDAHLGVYKKKGRENCFIAFGEHDKPLTHRENWVGYVQGKYFAAGIKFDIEFLEYFTDEFEFIGKINFEQTIANLELIRSKLPAETKMILLNGSEVEYIRNKKENLKQRHLEHRELNRLAASFADEHDNVYVVDVNRYITGQESFTNNINHFSKSIYYEISNEIISVVNDTKGLTLKHRGRRILWLQMVRGAVISALVKIKVARALRIVKYYLQGN